MAAVTIDSEWKLWRVSATKAQDSTLRKVSTLSAEAAHEYRMGRTPVGYTQARNSMILKALTQGVPETIVAIASGLSVTKVRDIRRESRALAAA